VSKPERELLKITIFNVDEETKEKEMKPIHKIFKMKHFKI